MVNNVAWTGSLDEATKRGSRVPVNFDGTNDYERRAAALTGMANGKIGLFGTWFRFLGTGQTSRFITFTTSSVIRFAIGIISTNILNVVGRNSAAANILEINTTATYADSVSIICCCRLTLSNVANRALLIDGVDAISHLHFVTIDWVPTTNPRCTIGAQDNGSILNGDLAGVVFPYSSDMV